MMENASSSRSSIGTDVPHDVFEIPEADLSLIQDWETIAGLSASVSDILDELGYSLSIPGVNMPTRLPGSTVVGRATTVRYLPSRRSFHNSTDGLIHKSAMKRTSPGDVLVIEGDKEGRYSVFGGLAAHNAKEVELAGLIVAGAVRDIDQIRNLGIPVWSESVTSITGRGRLQGMGINVPVQVGEVQVRAGDVVVADDSGVCFIPVEILSEVDERLRRLVHEEQQIIGKNT